MRLVVDTAPDVEPVTLADAKRHANVDDSFHDNQIEGLIAAARGHAERVTERQFITAVYVLHLEAFPEEIEIPKPPLQTIDAIKYIDPDGVEQTMTVDVDYQLVTGSEPARVRPAYGTVWPTTKAVADAITVEFTAGYGDAASDVPADIRLAMMILVAHWYRTREPIIEGHSIADVPLSAVTLLKSYELGKLVWN
jgi:uncharacterized phiE125 gp8 family phage protein